MAALHDAPYYNLIPNNMFGRSKRPDTFSAAQPNLCSLLPQGLFGSVPGLGSPPR
jgi:hypothetical protein